MLFINAVALILIIVEVFIRNLIRSEKREYNNGFCLKCGAELILYDDNTPGIRCYKCSECKYPVFVTFTCVDKKKGRKQK